MAITNRDNDASQQKETATVQLGFMGTTTTRSIWISPYPCTLQSVRSCALGCSGAMALTFEKLQAGVAGTSGIPMSISNMILQNRGTSGTVGYSGLATPGATGLMLATGDVITITSSVSNTAAADLTLEFVLKKTQDIVSHNSVST